MKGRIDFQNLTVTLEEIEDYIPIIKQCSGLIMIGCGTSYHSGVATRQIFEELSLIPVTVEIASDFLDRKPQVFRNDAFVFLSQSGETAETLMALKYCKQRGALIIAVTNVAGSSLYREAHCGIHINAGPEISLASQFISIVMFALVMSGDFISQQKRRIDIISALQKLPEHIEQVLSLNSKVLALARDLIGKKSLLVLGRGYNFATCLEAALKLKEVVLIHSEGIMVGDIKHGPLALIDDSMPVVMIITRDAVYDKCINPLQQITARRGKPILICEEGDARPVAFSFDILRIPQTVDCLQRILTIILMQLLSFHLAVLRGLDVDFSRNLAKSVTFE